MAHSFSIRSPRFRTVGSFIALLALALAACTPTTSISTPAPALPSATRSSAPPPATQIPTLEPSPTPASPQVILLIPDGAEPGLAASVQARLADLAEASGLRLEPRSALALEDLDSQVKLVVALPPITNLADIAAQAPQTNFLAIGIPGLRPAANLQTISLGMSRPDQQAFLAGYLSAVITPDWRVGVLSQAGSAAGKAARLGFANGATYFCGLCRPAYPPFPPSGYPMAFELGNGAGDAEWQAAISELKAGGVQTVYVDPALASDALLKALAQAEFHIISSGPRPAGLQEQWVASITSSDPLQALEAAWMAWTGGTSTKSTDHGLTLTDVNESLLSPGRLHLVENLGADLFSGYIDTGADPATGEDTSQGQQAP